MAKVKILGKVRSFKGSLKVYRILTKKDPQVYQIDRSLYWKIIAEYHKLIADKMLESGHDYRLPKSMGDIFIRKYKSSKLRPRIDWAEYNKSGKVEMLGAEFYEDYHAKFVWKRNPKRVKNVTLYSFRPVSSNKFRLSKEVLYNGKDKVYSKSKNSLKI